MDIKLMYNYKRLRPSLNSLSNLVMDLLFHPSRVFHLYANFQPIDIDRHISIAPLLPERNTERYIILCKWLAVRTMDPAPKTENWFRKPQLMLSDLDTFFQGEIWCRNEVTKVKRCIGDYIMSRRMASKEFWCRTELLQHWLISLNCIMFSINIVTLIIFWNDRNNI